MWKKRFKELYEVCEYFVALALVIGVFTSFFHPLIGIEITRLPYVLSIIGKGLAFLFGATIILLVFSWVIRSSGFISRFTRVIIWWREKKIEKTFGTMILGALALWMKASEGTVDFGRKIVPKLPRIIIFGGVMLLIAYGPLGMYRWLGVAGLGGYLGVLAFIILSWGEEDVKGYTSQIVATTEETWERIRARCLEVFLVAYPPKHGWEGHEVLRLEDPEVVLEKPDPTVRRRILE